MRAHRITEFGEPSVLGLVEVDEPVCGPQDLLVEHDHIGVNFVDTQHRRGTPYPVQLPLIPGIEAAGRVSAVGDQVHEFAIGDRIAYGGIMPGAYAERASIPSEQAVAVPDAVSSESAAAVLLQGWTAHMLCESVAPAPGGGDTVVVYAAAGGTGSLLVQMAVARGRRVIGITSGPDRCRFVAALGAHAVVDRRAGDVLAAVLEVCPGGVDVVFEAVGRAAFSDARQMLRPRGHLVSYGQSSGPVPPIDPALLSGITSAGGPGSLTLTWPTLNDHDSTAADRRDRADRVFTMLREGKISAHVGQVFDLSDAAEAHRLLEAGEILGKAVLSVSR